MLTNDRTACWRGLRKQLKMAVGAETADLRNAHIEQAAEYAERLAANAAGGPEEPTYATFYIDCALTDIGREGEWRVPL